MALDWSLGELRDSGQIAPDWAEALRPVQGELLLLAERLKDQEDWLPAAEAVFRAFQAPLAEVRVLIVGQDPYPTAGHGMGLAFSVAPEVRPLPRSLRNVFRERESDLGMAPSVHGDLSAWAERGVLLLNRALTVQEGNAGSHRGLGWEAVTGCAIRALAAREHPLVAILWGAQARELAPLLAGHTVLESAHPSPLSAARGFFGSRPFSATNEALRSAGGGEIDWSLPAPPPGTRGADTLALW